VRVTPRASADAVVGWRADGALGVRVTAPPVEGAANRAVETLVAEALGLPRSAVGIARGTRGRDKLVRVAGLTLEEIRARLEPRARERKVP
jgi:uncharacterized protein YggU (UPF0235/DUF167 family)